MALKKKSHHKKLARIHADLVPALPVGKPIERCSGTSIYLRANKQTEQ